MFKKVLKQYFILPEDIHSQFRSLDGIRFISSLGIVLFHYSFYLDGHFSDIFQMAKKFYLFVDAFFVISGVIISMMYGDKLRNIRSYARFILRRLSRLYPLHIATLLFYASLGILNSYKVIKVANSGKYDFHDFLPNLFLVHAWGTANGLSFNHVSWSISADLFVYLMFPVFLVMVSLGVLRGALFISITWLSLLFFSWCYLGKNITTLSIDFGFIRATASFLIGIYFYIYRIELLSLATRVISRDKINWLSNLLVIMLLFAILSGVNDIICLFLIYITIAAHMLSDVCQKKTIVSGGGLPKMSQLTYSVYMLHTIPATIIISYIFPHFVGNGSYSVMLSIVLSIVTTYVLALVSYNVFEMPVRNKLNSLF